MWVYGNPVAHNSTLANLRQQQPSNTLLGIVAVSPGSKRPGNYCVGTLLGDTFAHCSLCNSDFSVSHGGKNDVTVHVKGKHHREAAKEVARTSREQTMKEAEARYEGYLLSCSSNNCCWTHVIVRISGQGCSEFT